MHSHVIIVTPRILATGADPENFQGGWLVSKSYNLGSRGGSRFL